MSPDEYERITSAIVAGICEQAPALSAYHPTVGKKSKALGKSGYRHQIDVCLRTDSAIYLIECKRWKDSIGIEEVMVLAARANDVAAESRKPVHAILATTIGASKNAVKIASVFQIKLEIVKSAREFGMQIGKYISVGLVSSAMATDNCEAEIVNRPIAG